MFRAHFYEILQIIVLISTLTTSVATVAIAVSLRKIASKDK